MDGLARPMTKDSLIGDLRAVWVSLDELLTSLDDDDWSAPTSCPGWSVQDTVAHIVGTEMLLAGHPAPDVELPELSHVRNDVGKMNEAWIVARRDCSPQEMLSEFRSVVAERTAGLSAMDQAAFDAESWTPAGMATLGRFMQIRVFDQWIHEQDIREAVGRVGHLEGPAVQRTLAEIALGVGFAVGKKAGAPDGSSVRFRLTGPVPASIDVVVDGRAKVVDDLQGVPTVTLTLDSSTFVRLVAGRWTDTEARERDQVTVEGDRVLGDRVLANLAYVI